MFDIFKSLIKLEGPDYILDNKSVGCGQLQSTTCCYAKAKRYYTATTFYTDVWISKSPLGPLSGEEPVVRTLSDVAIIREYKSAQACTSYPTVSKQDLETYLSQINRGIDLYLERLVPPDGGDVCRYKLMLSPIPCVVASILCGTGLVGTMIVFMDGHIMPVMSCYPRMQDYVERARELSRNDGPRFKLALPEPLVVCDNDATGVKRMKLGGD